MSIFAIFFTKYKFRNVKIFSKKYVTIFNTENYTHKKIIIVLRFIFFIKISKPNKILGYIFFFT